MAKKIKTVAGTDGYEYPVTSYELVVDENGESVKTKLAQLSGGSGGSAEAGGTGLTSEQEQQLNTAYTHSQTTHVQASDIPTKTSQLTNDSSFATETYVANKIAEASLSGGEVDLSGYVTKEIGNASQITFSDGQTFQAKLNAGTLKGAKGDKGDKGDTGATGARGPKGDTGERGQDGLTTAISVNGNTYTQVNGTITLPNYPTGSTGSTGSSGGGSAHLTPAMYGGVGDGVTDDSAALQACLDIEGCVVIDLMGKTWYSSKTLNLVKPRKTIQNGNIITDGNTFENKTAWLHSIRFINLNITSRNGYVFYIRNIDDKLNQSEFYDNLYLSLKLDGKLGGYYAHNSLIGFSQTFIDVHVKSASGNGFSGLKGPGTTMLHCVNEGIPNGALFYNCFCEVINSDSNNLMKHGIQFSGYFNGSLARFKSCNFEHCIDKGLNCTTDGLKIELDHCQFTKTYKAQDQINSECMYINSPKKVKISDILINGFDYGDGYYDLVYKGSPYFEMRNIRTLKASNSSFYRLSSFVLPEVFDGQVKINEVTKVGTSPVIERYTENEISNYNSANFMTMFYRTKTKDVTLDSEGLLELGKDTPLSNQFVIKDSTITAIKGVLSTYTDKIGNGSIISIKNDTTNAVTLTNKHWAGRQFIFKADTNKTLAEGESIIFVVKDNKFYEWI